MCNLGSVLPCLSASLHSMVFRCFIAAGAVPLICGCSSELPCFPCRLGWGGKEWRRGECQEAGETVIRKLKTYQIYTGKACAWVFRKACVRICYHILFVLLRTRCRFPLLFVLCVWCRLRAGWRIWVRKGNRSCWRPPYLAMLSILYQTHRLPAFRGSAKPHWHAICCGEACCIGQWAPWGNWKKPAERFVCSVCQPDLSVQISVCSF